MKAIYMEYEGGLSVLETPEAGVAGLDTDMLQAIDDGLGILIRWNNDHYEEAKVSSDTTSEDEDDEEGETTFELEWSLIA